MIARLVRYLAVSVAAVVVAQSAQAQEYKFRLHHFLSPTAPTHTTFLVPWAERVEQQSGGRITIEIVPAMGLGGKPPQLVDQVVDGRADMVWTLPGYTPGRFPMTETFELPGVAGRPDHTNLALADFYDRYLQQEYADMRVLLLHAHAGQAFHSTKPIRTAADLKGMNVRAPSAAGTIWLQAAGANPVHAPLPQIPELLSRNVVDSVMIPFEVAPSVKTHELTKFHTTLPDDGRIHTAVFLFAMNNDAYAGLPPDLQQIIDANSRANVAADVGRTWLANEEPGKQQAAARGNEFIEIDPAEVPAFEAINARTLETWVAANTDKFDAAKLIDDARALVAKHAGAGS